MASDQVYDAVRSHLAARWSETPVAWESEESVATNRVLG